GVARERGIEQGRHMILAQRVDDAERRQLNDVLVQHRAEVSLKARGVAREALKLALDPQQRYVFQLHDPTASPASHRVLRRPLTPADTGDRVRVRGSPAGPSAGLSTESRRDYFRSATSVGRSVSGRLSPTARERLRFHDSWPSGRAFFR